MSENATPLKPKQWQAVALLAAGKSQGETASQLSVSPSTLYRWLHTPEFRQAVNEAVSEQFERSVAMASDLAVVALVGLKATITDPQVQAYVRVQACQAALTYAHNAWALKHKIESGERDDVATPVIISFGEPVGEQDMESRA